MGDRRTGTFALVLSLLAAIPAGLLAAPAVAEAPPAANGFVERLLEGARRSIERRPRYAPSYARIAYPGGDPGLDRGVCTDLVVRAFRHAGIDLQRLVHEDARRSPSGYRIGRLDPNIDHRRVPNLLSLFRRHARVVPAGEGEWRPGDIVVWDLHGDARPTHIGIVSDRRSEGRTPLVIHHFPPWPTEEDCLTRWKILAHFRWGT